MKQKDSASFLAVPQQDVQLPRAKNCKLKRCLIKRTFKQIKFAAESIKLLKTTSIMGIVYHYMGKQARNPGGYTFNCNILF
jgi:hypothetical protein